MPQPLVLVVLVVLVTSLVVILLFFRMRVLIREVLPS
jgi:hypothetical protein